MHDNVLAYTRERSVVRAKHFLDIMNAFGIVVEKPQRHLDDIAGVEFAQVGQMNFEGEERIIRALYIVGSQAEKVEGFISGAIENYIVVSHVKMAVVVDPLVLHPVRGTHEGRREDHRYFSHSC